MGEFDVLDRCAAYAAARDALEALASGTAGWPDELADQARAAAVRTVLTIAEATAHDHASAARRRCLRDALAGAIELTACWDIACALGVAGRDRDQPLRLAGRTVALLGLFLHANASPIAEDSDGDTSSATLDRR